MAQQADRLEKTITKTVTADYLVYVPEHYAQSDENFPLILFLHGAGERGHDLELVKVHGIPKIVSERTDFPFITVSPQCPSGSSWLIEKDAVIALLDEIIAKYRVDTSRVYLTGLSMGGFGTWHIAAEYPERFAAIAPICGGGQPLTAQYLKDMPVWAFHGAKDDIVPLKATEDMVNALRNIGNNVKFTVYPEAKHDSWTETYNNKALYEWFLQHQKSELLTSQ